MAAATGLSGIGKALQDAGVLIQEEEAQFRQAGSVHRQWVPWGIGSLAKSLALRKCPRVIFVAVMPREPEIDPCFSEISYTRACLKFPEQPVPNAGTEGNFRTTGLCCMAMRSGFSILWGILFL